MMHVIRITHSLKISYVCMCVRIDPFMHPLLMRAAPMVKMGSPCLRNISACKGLLPAQTSLLAESSMLAEYFRFQRVPCLRNILAYREVPAHRGVLPAERSLPCVFCCRSWTAIRAMLCLLRCRYRYLYMNQHYGARRLYRPQRKHIRMLAPRRQGLLGPSKCVVMLQCVACCNMLRAT